MGVCGWGAGSVDETAVTLGGLMSRCTTPLSWALASALPVCTKIVASSRGVSAPRAMRCARSSPVRSSMVMNGVSSGVRP